MLRELNDDTFLDVWKWYFQSVSGNKKTSPYGITCLMARSYGEGLKGDPTRDPNWRPTPALPV